MKITSKLIILALSSLLLAGCGTTGGDADGGGAAVDDRSTSSGASGGAAYAGEELNDPNSLLSKRVVYFDFDSDSIKGDFRDIIKVHAGYLAAKPGESVVLEGHADERGTREYNVALGERRANAVRQMLILQGASASQIQTVSYGEEKPAALGHDEEAWRLNRRVEFVYQR